jgi:two-component system CheB/CheR fusion protein
MAGRRITGRTGRARATKRTVEKKPLDEAASKVDPPAQRALVKVARAGASAPQAVIGDRALMIVGVGASAGGLDAFLQLMHDLPAQPGLAFVLVQHMAPQHESALAELLGARSKLPVRQAQDGTPLEVDHVYVNPPNAEMTLEGGVLRLTPRPKDRSQFTPIDALFRSLAASAGDRAIAIVLSGTASDGSSGLSDVKAAGGLTIAQRPETAKYDGMPRSAIATGMVDLVLSPEEIARTLVAVGTRPPERGDANEIDEPLRGDKNARMLDRILTMLRNSVGVDFRQYKRPTIERRVNRRMVLTRMSRLEDYVQHLEKNPAEIQALFHDVLILVTRFFRDPEAFEAISSVALPKIFDQHQQDGPIRVWVAGCSTGEEAYSIAILLIEFLADHDSSVPIQVFATDISDRAVDHARSGLYPASISADVSEPRLRRFFTKTESGYRINKSVRDVCVFARQDITRDPPFSRLDLVVCRNVLIYLSAPVQQKLMTLFHYSLRPFGFLLLGTAETTGQHSDLFRIEDKRSRLYTKKQHDAGNVVFPADYPAQLTVRGRGVPVVARVDARSVQHEADQIIQERYAPPGVIVDADLQIVQFRGHTGVYLEPAPGDPSTNLLKMARDGLLYGLRSAVQLARRTGAPARREGLRVKRNGGWQEFSLEVLPLASSERAHFLVLFHPAAPVTHEIAVVKPVRGKRGKDADHDLEALVARLQQELDASREYLQPIIQELEGANEELQSANEEILSANEELQSTNEELDTAKEELQSTNEELNTVNDELRGRNEELSRVNSDLENLIASVQIAIVIVARDLRIRRFTPMAERVLNLLHTDLGRPITHIKPNIDCPDLEHRIEAVLDSVTPQECEVEDRNGKRFLMRIRPYKDLENRIDGAVLALFETDMVPARGAVS